jgi:hypothetical protein
VEGKFKAQSSKFKAQSSKFKAQSSKLKAQSSKFKVQSAKRKASTICVISGHLWTNPKARLTACLTPPASAGGP